MEILFFKFNSAYNLTAQEILLFELTAIGLSVTEIADKMAKSYNRIRQLRNSVIRKLRARNINHAVAIMLSNKIIDKKFLGLSSRASISATLTAIEIQSITLAAQGCNIHESALMMHKSPDRIKQVRSSVLQKMNATNMIHAIVIAILDKIISLKAPLQESQRVEV